MNQVNPVTFFFDTVVNSVTADLLVKLSGSKNVYANGYIHTYTFNFCSFICRLYIKYVAYIFFICKIETDFCSVFVLYYVYEQNFVRICHLEH